MRAGLLGRDAAPLAAPRSPGQRVRQAVGLVVDDDPIAHAADGDDVRAAGVLDLRAQAGEVRLEPEQVGIGLGRPAGTGQLQVRDDVAVRPDERLEQAELGRRQRQRRLADARLVAAGLQDQAAGLERAGRRAAGARVGRPGA